MTKDEFESVTRYCPDCKGTGEVRCEGGQPSQYGVEGLWAFCATCEGRGRIFLPEQEYSSSMEGDEY